jgi:hypothetical protein
MSKNRNAKQNRLADCGFLFGIYLGFGIVGSNEGSPD